LIARGLKCSVPDPESLLSDPHFRKKKENFRPFFVKNFYSFFDHTGFLSMISTSPVMFIFGNNLTTAGRNRIMDVLRSHIRMWNIVNQHGSKTRFLTIVNLVTPFLCCFRQSVRGEPAAG
jgi:hypothetical protein